MRRLLFLGYIALAVAILVALTLPLMGQFLPISRESLPFDDKVLNISPVFLLGLIAVFALKWWTHEPEQGPSDARTEQKQGSVVGWILAIVAGGLVGVLAREPVAAAVCTHVSQMYC